MVIYIIDVIIKKEIMEARMSFNMDWQILVLYPEPEARDKIY